MQNIVEREMTYGEFLTYQEKYPKARAIFTFASFEPLNVNSKGRVSIFLDPEKTWN